MVRVGFRSLKRNLMTSIGSAYPHEEVILSREIRDNVPLTLATRLATN